MRSIVSSSRIQPVAIAVAYLATLVVNYLAVSLPIGGMTTAQIASQYPIYFLPANFTFSIWGLIYLAVGLFVIEQFHAQVRADARVRRIGWLFVVSCLANCAWLILFQNRLFALSMVAMVALLLVLIAIYTRLAIGRPQARRGSEGAEWGTRARWTVQLPFSLYLGWISVATIANASYMLYDLGWDGFGLGGQAWAIVMLLVAAGLTLIVVADRRDIAYTLVVFWALLGIAVRQSAVAPAVSATADVLGVLLVLALVLRYIWPRWQPRWPSGAWKGQAGTNV